MNITIVGAGSTGQSLIKNLVNDGHDIVVVDESSAKVQECIERYDVNGVVGNGCLAPILEEAGVAECDLLISVTDKDAMNILICLVGKQLGAHHTIAQARNPEFYTNFDQMGDRMGINMFVNAEATMADMLTRMLKAPADVVLNPFGGGRLEIAELTIPANSRICGKTLQEIRKDKRKAFLVLSVLHDGEILVPNGNTVIQGEDSLTVCLRHQDLRDILGYFGIERTYIRSVMLLGTTESTYYTSAGLLAMGMNVKVIGKMQDECEDLKTRLPELTVVCDDYNNKEVLLREGLDQMDALVAMTRSDEKNIVASLYAKTRNVPKVITVVVSDLYHDMLEDIDLNLVLSPYSLVGASIARYVRSINVPVDSQIVAMYSVSGGKAEALQFNIGSNPAFVGKTIVDIAPTLTENVLLCAILRKRSAIIPQGDTLLEENDDILIFSLDTAITKLEDILR